MSVERLLQINVAIQAVLATVLLGLGQEKPYLPLVALFAAVVSLVFTDTFGWFRLNRGVANLFALIAAGYSLSSFVRFDKEQQLLSIANLLVYLQFILFFQQKTPRVYWQLIVLGLLQVVVAVALSLGAVSAVIILAYMVAGVSSLSLFFLHREALRVTGSLPRSVLTIRGRRVRPPKPQPTTKPRAVFLSNPQALSRELVGARLVRQVLGMSALSLLFATVLFFTVPRRGDSIWYGPGTARAAKVGFSGMQGISFKEEGLIEESDEPVMRVAFRNPQTGKLYPVVGRPYLRGTVLYHYSASRKRWWQRVDRRRSGNKDPLPLPPANTELVRQEVVLEPSDGQVLFSAYPWWRESEEDRVALDNVNDSLTVARSGLNFDGGPFRYAVLTDAFRSGWQIRAAPFLTDPYRFRESPSTMSWRLSAYLTDMNADSRPDTQKNFVDLLLFPKLREQAKQVIDASPSIDPGNHLQVAKALEEHFRTSGQYRYSLDFRNIRRDPTLDPIEDFVANHRTGHCEYYAGALALMLRSRNIPSRIVVGFVGGEFNSLGGFFQVRAKDAHAWVEAYIAPAHFDDEMPVPLGAERTGVWFRLDPTPAPEGGTTADAGRSPLMHKVDQFLNYFRFVWSDYVVGLDEQRRQQAVRGNLPDQHSAALGGSRIRSWLDRAARMIGIANRDKNGELRVRWPMVVRVLLGILLLVVVVARISRLIRSKGNPEGRTGLRRLMSRIGDILVPLTGRRLTENVQKRQKNTIVFEFYPRLARLVAPLGLVRTEGQTQQEFAETIRGRLLQLKQAESIASLPATIVEIFYRVRFGGAALDMREQENIEQALSNLEKALAINHD